jgi:hypothetical protein
MLSNPDDRVYLACNIFQPEFGIRYCKKLKLEEQKVYPSRLSAGRKVMIR